MDYLSEDFKNGENYGSVNLLNEQSQHESLLYDDQSFDSEAADMFGCAVSPEDEGRIHMNFSMPGDSRNGDDRMKVKTPPSVSPAKYYAQSFHHLDDLINERRAELSALRKKNKQKILEKLLELKSPTSAQQLPSLQLGDCSSFKSPEPTAIFVSVSTGTNTDLGLNTDDLVFGPGATGMEEIRDISGSADSAGGMRSRPPRSSSYSGDGGKTQGSGGGILPVHVVGVAAIPRGSPLYTGRSQVKAISTPEASRSLPIENSEDGNTTSTIEDHAYAKISELEKLLSGERLESARLRDMLGMAEVELATLTKRLRSVTQENSRLDERNKQMELWISSQNGGGIPDVPVLQSVDGSETNASEDAENFAASISGEFHRSSTFTTSIQEVGEKMMTPSALLSEPEAHDAQADIAEVRRQLAELQQARLDLENDLMLATRSALDWEAHAAALSTHFQPLLDEAEAQRLQLMTRYRRGANVLFKLLCVAWGDKERFNCLLCFRTLALYAARQRHVSLAPSMISTPLKTQDGRNSSSINGPPFVHAVPNNSSTVANLFGGSPSKPSSTSIVSSVSAPHLVPAVTAAAVSSQSSLATVSRWEAVQVTHKKLAQIDAASRLETRRRNISFLISLAFYQTFLWALLLALSSYFSRTPSLADLQCVPSPHSLSALSPPLSCLPLAPTAKPREPPQCNCPLSATNVETLAAAPATERMTYGTSDRSTETVAGATDATVGSVTGSSGYSFPLSRDPRRLPPRTRERDREGGGGAPWDRLDRDSREGRGDRLSRGARELDAKFLPPNRQGQW